MKELLIAGAGPGGITAGINLALSGFKVIIYDKAQEVGARFNNDFQGLENCSHEGDVLDLLASFHLPLDFIHVPVSSLDLLDEKLTRTVIKSQKAGMYLVKRGTDSDSFDQALKRRAMGVGVEFRLGQPLSAEKAHIVAWGPKRAAMVAAGLNFHTGSADRVAVVFSNQHAPGGYSYLAVAQGRGTLGTVLFSNFTLAKGCLAKTVEAFIKVYDLEIREPVPFSGYGDFHLRSSFSQNGTLLVGEAAGFQDYWLGFGIRYAVTSGFLAARAISEGLNYDQLLKEEGIIDLAKASLANRFLYETRGRHSYQWLIKKWSQAPEVSQRLKKTLQLSPSRRALYYLARLALGRKRRLVGPPAPGGRADPPKPSKGSPE